jgi:hypothetical protein
MATITLFIDDSAEDRRRKRQRWIEVAIVLVLLPVLAVLASRREGGTVPVVGTVDGTDGTNTTDKTDTTDTTTATTITDTVVTMTETSATETSVTPQKPPQPLAVTPAAMYFNARGLPAQLVTIKNAEYVLLKSSGKDFLVTDNCKDGAPCVAAVVFTPASEGRRDGELRVIGNGGTRTVRLSGFTPVTPPPPPPPPPPPKPQCAAHMQPAIDPPQVHFIGSGRRTITLSNPHPCALRVDAINLMSADRPDRKASGYKLIGDVNCKRELQPGDRCSFDVATSPWHFTPRATIDLRSTVVTP